MNTIQLSIKACQVIASVSLMIFAGTSPGIAVDGTYTVTESWSATLQYSHWADGISTTKYYSGTQSGTLVISAGNYHLIDRSGVPWASPGRDLTKRSIYDSGFGCSVSGSYVFGAAFGADAHGILFLGGFVVSVPLIDGEVPIFYDYDTYSGSGTTLTSIHGGGYMKGMSLTVTVSSTLSLRKVVGPPGISQQPLGQTVYAGQDARFSVTATGDPPFTYTWRKGDSVISGARNSVLVLTNVQPADAGSYSVVVSNPGGKITSSAAVLSVLPPPRPWFEGWETAAPQDYIPSSNSVVFISADKGRWVLGDTVSNFGDCGPVLNRATVFFNEGRKLLRLVSVNSHSGCSDNRNNNVVYVFQRAPDYVEHALTNGPSNYGSREVFLDPAGGSFRRNLYEDLASIAGTVGVGTTIVAIQFYIASEGWAELDDLCIGPNLMATDDAEPTVAITSPPNGTRLSNDVATVTGTARDTVGVADVFYSVNESVWALASSTNGWRNWAATASLVPGSNTVRAYAVDLAGNASATSSVSIVWVVTAPLTVAIGGTGSVQPDYNGRMLRVDKEYTITAVPAAGCVFSNWSGDVSGTSNVLRFVMRSNLVIQANFVPNPFLDHKGTYQGLYYEPEGARHESAGAFTLTLRKSGAYTATLLGAGQTHSLSGVFSLDGRATNFVGSGGLATVEWTLDFDHSRTNYLTGAVTGAGDTWVASLIGDLVPVYGTEVSPYRGKYTVVIPGARSESVTDQPAGDSFGSVVVSPSGLLTFSGALADGKAVTQSASVSAHGIWPLYLSLYGGKGSLLGWVQLNTNPPPADAMRSDAVLWARPEQTNAAYFPQGFEVVSRLVGSRYKPASPVVPLGEEGEVRFLGGGLLNPLTNQVTLTSSNTIINQGPNPMTMTLTRSNGWFNGTNTLPAGAAPIAFQGAMLQDRLVGYGFFRNAGQSGWVVFGPRPSP